MNFEPHDYQKYIINRIVSQKRLALLLDMGTGKTACALTAINWLENWTMEFGKALVIAPKKVAESSWPDEISKWDQLKGLRVSKILGSAEERERALNSEADVYLMNRENCEWLVDQFVKASKPNEIGKPWPFGMVVFDESSSFKNRATRRWKAAKAMATATPRVLLLTGTPAPNGLEDLWAQIYLLDGGERLGRCITAYRQMYFHPGAHNGHVVFEYLPNKGSDKEIYSAIKDIAISLKAGDVLTMPERIDEKREVILGDEAMKKLKRMEKDYLLEMEGKTITAASAGVLENKLIQLADGAIYGDDGSVNEIHEAKMDELQKIVEENDGKNVLVFYNYRFDEARIMKALKDLKPKKLETAKDVTDWNKGKIKVLLANPSSSAFGLNLQEGGHTIVWLTPIWNLELYQQANARLYRQGQKQPVIIYSIIAKGTEDERVMEALEGKAATQDDLIKAVKARIKEART